MSESLNVKDLITVGIFSVIMVILIFIFGMLGYIPILMVTLPIIVALICGIPYMLFLTRVSKFGMTTLLGLILGIVMFLSGHTWVPILIFTGFALIADIILKTGDYSSVSKSIISHGVFILGILGNMLPFYILRDYYINHLRDTVGNAYVGIITPFLTYEFLIILVILTFIAGCISAYIGKFLLKKHFERAGIT